MSIRAAKGLAVVIAAAAFTAVDPEARYLLWPLHDASPGVTADAEPSR